MKRLAVLAAGLLWTHSLSLPAAEPAPAPEDARWRFDWSPPCRVPVREVVEKKGQIAVLRYAIDLQPSAQDGVLEVRFLDLRFEELNGQDVSGPAWQQRLGPTVRAASDAMPTLLVSREGLYLGLRGYEETIRKIEEMQPRPDGASVAAFLRSAPAQEMVVEKVGDTYWRTWVEAWLDWPLDPGASREDAIPYALPGGDSTSAQVRAEHQGLTEGYARLRLTVTVGGPAIASLLEPLLQELVGPSPSAAELDALLKGARAVTRLYVETTPETLRPRLSRFEREVDLEAQGEHPQQREVHTLTWDWSAAVGCGR